MKNPYKADDAVMTTVKGKKVEALVTQTWQNEVQVKTVDGDLLWRSMYTVWLPGQEPLSRQVPQLAKNTPTPKPSQPKLAGANSKTGRNKSKSKRARRSRSVR